MKKLAVILAVAGLLLAGSGSAEAAILSVGPDGYPTIQAAVNAANSSGDTITVVVGTYYENVIIDKSLTLAGAGAGSSIVDAGGSGSVFRVGTVDDSVAVTISGFTIQDGAGTPHPSYPAYTYGGGIYNKATLTLADSVVAGNSATYTGGGIVSYNTMSINRSSVSDNTISTSIYGPSGGGIMTYNSMTVTDSTISGNTCHSDAYGMSSGSGGGIMSYGISSYGWDGDLTMTNSTVSGNSSGSDGGGISMQDGDLDLLNLTITDNEVLGGNNQGGGIFIYGGTHVVRNSIVAGNTATVGDMNIMKSNCSWTWSSGITTVWDLGYVDPDPLLGPLANNGGPTLTHALLAGSPAIDAGDDLYAPDWDQRGMARPYGAASDIGAYEYIPEPASLIVWSLLGAIGITVGWWRRRRKAA